MHEQLRDNFLQMARLLYEEIHVWFYDKNGVVVKHWIAAQGGARSAALSLRDLFQMAWEQSAHAMLIAHNHPYGNPAPSETDDDFTNQVRELGVQCECVLLDHVVVGETHYYSYNEDAYKAFHAANSFADKPE